jgi:hypothetical protein
VEKLIQYGIDNNAIFLSLFVLSIGGLAWLIKWILKTNDDRETRYITTIDKLSDSLEVVKDVKTSVERIERKLEVRN